MITLVTGTPGAGKTLFTVSDLLPRFEGRRLFVDGIPDLLMPHEQPLGPVEEWPAWLPENGVLVVDECQRIWRPRATSAKVPESIAAMETHRHKGQDLVLITQHPNLIDGNARRLIGRHLHVRRVWGMARALVYEWDAATDPNRISTATKRPWSYPKKAFELYKSATAHHARGQRIPMIVWMIPVALAIAAFAGWRVWGMIHPDAKPPITAHSPDVLTPEAAARPAQVLSPADFLPVYHDLPGSAPAYDGLNKVVSAPVVSACVASPTRCICYSQQQTRLDISDSKCRAVASGKEFDPYRPDDAREPKKASGGAPPSVIASSEKQT